MYSCVSVLQKSAASCGLVESHETSTMRLVPDERTLTPPPAVPSASCHNCSGVGGFIFSALRHMPRRSGGCRLSRCLPASSFACTRSRRPRLWRSLTCVWMSVSRYPLLVSDRGLTLFMFRNSSLSPWISSDVRAW